MELFIIYLILLLIVLFLIYNGIKLCLKYAPLKIKYLGVGIFVAMFLRYIVLGLMFIVKNIKYLYILKPVYFINFISVPVAAFIVIYILARHDKIKINFVFILLISITAAYALMLYKLPSYINLYENLGYSMYLEKINMVYAVYILLNTLILFITILLLDTKLSNKPGLILVLISAVITIAEVLLRVNGIKFMPEVVLGDLVWMLSLNYSLSRFKK